MPSTSLLIRNIFPDARHRTTAIAIWSTGSSGWHRPGAPGGRSPARALLVERLPHQRPGHGGRHRHGTVAPAGVQERSGPRWTWPPAVLSVLAIVPITYAVKSFAHDGLTVVAIARTGGRFGRRLAVHRASAHAEPLLIDVELFRRPHSPGPSRPPSWRVFALAGLLYFFSQYLPARPGLSTPEPATDCPRRWPPSLLSRSSPRWCAGWAWLGARSGLAGGRGGAGRGRWGVLRRIVVIKRRPARHRRRYRPGLHGLHRSGPGSGACGPGRSGLGHLPRPVSSWVALGIAVLGTIPGHRLPAAARARPSSLPAAGGRGCRAVSGHLAGAIDLSNPGQAELMVQAREAFTCAMQATAVIAAVILWVRALWPPAMFRHERDEWESAWRTSNGTASSPGRSSSPTETASMRSPSTPWPSTSD